MVAEPMTSLVHGHDPPLRHRVGEGLEGTGLHPHRVQGNDQGLLATAVEVRQSRALTLKTRAPHHLLPGGMSACRWMSFQAPSSTLKISVVRNCIATGLSLPFIITLACWTPVQ